MSETLIGDLRNFEGKLPKAVKEFLEHNGILKARVIRTCPDCADAPVYVIVTEAWEAFVCACDNTECLVRANPDEPVTVTTKRAAAEEWDYQGNDVSCRMDFETWWAEREAAARALLQVLLPGARVAKEVRVVFDGPPGPKSGRFVEVETPDGASVSVGEWHEREDGLWELRMLATSKQKEGR